MKSTGTNFYEVWFDDSNPRAMIAKNEDLRGMDRWAIYSGARLEQWSSSVAFFVDGEEAEDYLFTALPGWVLISGKAKVAIESIADPESAQFLPVHVLKRNGPQEIGHYWLLHALRLVQALHWERTTWLHPTRKYQDENPALDIVQPALRTDLVKGLDIFRLKVREVIMGLYFSDRLVRGLKQSGATTGFKFVPVPDFS